MSTWLWWSSGKDSAWALHTLREAGDDVTALVTTVNRSFDRVAMHGVREVLLEAQVKAAGLPLEVVEIPHPCSNEVYERAVDGLIERAREASVTRMAFGDLFLEDIRSYRIGMLEGTGMQPVFPIWGRDTAGLAAEMQAGWPEARVTCIDPKRLPRSFAASVSPPASPGIDFGPPRSDGARGRARAVGSGASNRKTSSISAVFVSVPGSFCDNRPGQSPNSSLVTAWSPSDTSFAPARASPAAGTGRAARSRPTAGRSALESGSRTAF